MNAPANVPANRANDAIVTFNAQLTKRADQFRMVLPSHITPEKFQRTVLTAVQADPELLNADRQSLLLACMKAAQDGLLPDKREAALVIFKRNFKDGAGNWQSALEVAYMPMVYGLRKKILQSGEITDITAKVVYRREAEEGYFIYEEGTEAMLRHKPMLELTEEEATDDNIVAAYSMATYKDGSKSYEVMRRFEIDKVRECSQTGATKDRYGKPRKPSGPWVEWFPEQAKKTVMRRHSKTLPMSGDIVDVEGMEIDVAARSTIAALGTSAHDEPEGPEGLRLPSGSELDEATGELLEDRSGTANGVALEQERETVAAERQATDSRGMTEVDEEDARRLDAQASGDGEPEADEQLDLDNDGQADWAAKAIEWLGGIKNARRTSYLNAIEEDYREVCTQVPKVLADQVEAALLARRGELGGK